MNRLRFLLALLLGSLATRAGSMVGNASVIGGRIALAVYRGFIRDARKSLNIPIVFVLGSNGKTTTSKYLVHLAEAAGETVLGNAAGSNMKTGIAALIIRNWREIRRARYSLGIFEVDEAYAASLAEDLAPEFAVVLNVQVDQIYRLFEPERVRDMFADTLPFVTRNIVVNGNDALLVDAVMQGHLPAEISFFGLSPQNDSDTSTLGLFRPQSWPQLAQGTQVVVAGSQVSVRRLAETEPLRVPTSGIHFALNGAAALELACRVLDSGISFATHTSRLADATPAFGRGETIVRGKATFEIVLFKNRPSLQLNIDAAATPADTVVLAFDEYSQDPSWLFAVDYSALGEVAVVSGEKADFLELALAYADIPVHHNDTDIRRVVAALDDRYRDLDTPSTHRLFLDYDQMMAVRQYFGLTMGETA